MGFSSSFQEYDKPVVRTPIPGPRSQVQVQIFHHLLGLQNYYFLFVLGTSIILWDLGIKVFTNYEDQISHKAITREHLQQSQTEAGCYQYSTVQYNNLYLMW